MERRTRFEVFGELVIGFFEFLTGGRTGVVGCDGIKEFGEGVIDIVERGLHGGIHGGRW